LAASAAVSGAGHASTASSTAATCAANAPHGAKVTTRSPTRWRLAGPTARTTPAASKPGVNDSGARTWYVPAIASRSGKLRPAAATSITQPSGGGAGGGMSSSERTSR
jgi:hypothetical protein